MSEPTAITFASFLLPPGIIVAAGLITTLVALLKGSIPQLANANGALIAFVFSLALYVLTAIAVQPANPDGYLLVFTSWLTCGGLAVGIKNVGAQVQQARTSP